MNPRRQTRSMTAAQALGVLAVVLIAALVQWQRSKDQPPPAPQPAPRVATPDSPQRPSAVRADIGFRSRAELESHYRKHGGEFGRITQDQYLRRAQELRDRPPGGDILEAVRGDGVTTRFDRTSGAFIAFNRDRTIRTFFRPNDGEAYFRRQLNRQEAER